MIVLVLGKHGQLASELADNAAHFPTLTLHFISAEDCDVTQRDQLERVILAVRPEVIINCAAYTAVDKAEDDSDRAFAVNEIGVLNIDSLAIKHGFKYIHISTDYVFDGSKREPYLESDPVNPIGIYGKSKRAGELHVLSSKADAIIIRAAWLYSTFGNNFMKTMLRLAKERTSINVVSDQIGTPTYAKDLALCCLSIVSNFPVLSAKGRLYHFSNSGSASWYEFANEIFRIAKVNCDVHPIPSTDYPTRAVRPKYSVLSNSKIQKDFGIALRAWKQALVDCLADEVNKKPL